jgi:hypothetical protein
MPGFDGTGPRGMGPMTGGGRGFCSPRGIGTASRPYGRFRGIRYGYPHYGTAPTVLGVAPFAPPMTREQELDFLRSQAEAMKEQLEQIDARIKQLETE